MDIRFQKIRQSQSPIQRKPVNERNPSRIQKMQQQAKVPVFEASLFTGNKRQAQQPGGFGSSQKSRTNSNNRPAGSQTERSYVSNAFGASVRDRQEREKPLLVVKVNLGQIYGQVTMGVWKDDTANTVSERIIKQSGVAFKDTKEKNEKVRQLSKIVEKEINLKVQ